MNGLNETAHAQIAPLPVPLRGQLTRPAVIRSLASTLRPACGGIKQRHHTLCRREYFALPKPIRDALYRGVGHGYEEAIIQAFAFLELGTFKVESGVRS